MRVSARGIRMQNIKVKGIFAELVIWIFAIYTCRGAWLAFDRMRYLPWFAYFSLASAALSALLGALYVISKRQVEREYLYYFLLPITFYFFHLIHTYGGYTGGVERTLATTGVFVLLPKNMKKEIFKRFYWIVQITNIISIIIWICYMTHINIGFHIEPYYTDSKYANYIRWFIFAIYRNSIHSSFMAYRLCSIFNEPGVLGTLCGLLFICTAKYSKKWEKVLLIIAGTLTYSLAFFLLVFLYIAIDVCSKKPRNIIFVVLFAAIFLAIPHIDFHNEYYNLIASRFAIVDGKFAGDNRTNDAFNYGYELFIKTSDIWFGKGYGYFFPGVFDNGSSYKSHFILPIGIFGFLIFMFQWIFAGLHIGKKHRNTVIFLFLFLISLYQRPSAIEGILGYIFVFGGIEWMNEQEESVIHRGTA